MPEHPDTASLFAQCIALNREAFAAGYYNTAYHALAAALYVAHARQETEGLARVECLAVEQLAVIDANRSGVRVFHPLGGRQRASEHLHDAGPRGPGHAPQAASCEG